MKRTFKSLASVATITTGLALGISGASAKTLLKMPGPFPFSLPVIGEVQGELAKEIERVSGGEITVKTYEPGKLIPAFEILDAVSSGKVNSGYSTAGYWAGKLPAAGFFSAVPFGPGTTEYVAWMYEGDGLKLYQEMYDQAGYNVKVIPCGMIPPETSGWYKKEIKSKEDLKGLRMRFFGLGAKVMEKLGVSTSLLPGGEVFSALDKGVIDAAEFSFPAIDRKLGFYKVAKFNYFPGWHQPSTFLELLINKDTWDKLSKKDQAGIELAARSTLVWTIARGESINSEAIEANKKDGVKVIYWSDDMLKVFEDTWNEVAAEQAAADPFFKKVWDNLSKFRAKYKTWGDIGYLPTRKGSN